MHEMANRRRRTIVAWLISLAVHGLLLAETRTWSLLRPQAFPSPIKIVLQSMSSHSSASKPQSAGRLAPAPPVQQLKTPAPSRPRPSVVSDRPPQPRKGKTPAAQGQASTSRLRPRVQKATAQPSVAPHPSPRQSTTPAISSPAQEVRPTDEGKTPATQESRDGAAGQNPSAAREEGPESTIPSSENISPAPVPLAQVAVAPVLLHHEIPTYPEGARRRGVEGVVRLEAVLNSDGQIEEEIKILESVPLLDATASTALKRWRFTPARDHQGRPVRVILEVPFRFALKDKTGRLSNRPNHPSS